MSILKKSDGKISFFTERNGFRFIWLFNKVKSFIKILHRKSSLQGIC